MVSFNFITDEALRSCLESDRSELERCLQAKAWKSVHVLAGSIIEAVLIDYLVFSGFKTKSGSDPLKMDLATAISACQQEGAITEKTSHLCSAIKDYRNLLHPGRSVRLGETIDENSAGVAHALLGIIAEEVSKKKRESYGYTAEQLVAKLEADPSARNILRDLLKGAHKAELERLLLNVIPPRHYELSRPKDTPEELLATLEDCFHSAFGMVPDPTKAKVANRLISVIKEGTGEIVLWYETAFFRAEQLKYLSDSESQLVRKHILGRARQEETVTLLRLICSLEEHITAKEAQVFTTVIVLCLFSESEELKSEADNYLSRPSTRMAAPIKEAVAHELRGLTQRLKEQGHVAVSQRVEQHQKRWDTAVQLESLSTRLAEITKKGTPGQG